MSRVDPYSATRIRRGAAYLIGGKALTALAGFGTFLVLVRGLPVEQFAAYSILFGMVELVDGLTGFGLGQILSRYVPELYVEHRRVALRRLVGLALAARIAVLAAFLATVYALAPAIAPLIGLADWEWALQAYLAVVVVRVAETTLFGVLESMLLQAVAQLGFGVVTVLRFALLALVSSQGALDLGQVILIELTTDLVGCGVMLIGLLRKMPRAAPDDPLDGKDWVRQNLRRMLGFGGRGYVQHLLILPFAGSTNRLLVGGALASAEVALFGFAQSAIDLIDRYMPVNLLAGVIRPVLTARYVRDRRFADLQFAANLIFKINATLICLAAVVIFSGGMPMLDALTRGKYTEGVPGLLVLMCALLLMFSLRTVLDQLCHALERNGPLIWGNGLMLLSFVPGVAMLPVVGVYALPAANLAGAMLGCGVLVWRLRQEGFDFRLDLGNLARLLAASGLAMGAALAVRAAGSGWFLAEAVAVAVFAVGLAAARPFGAAEIELLRSMAGRPRPR